MQRLAYEQTVQDDIAAILATGGVSNVYDADVLRAGTATAVGIRVYDASSALDSGTLPAGFLRVPVLLDITAHVDEDNDSAVLLALAGTVREAVFTDDIVSRLNVVSSYATYYGLEMGGCTRQVEGRIRHIEQSLTLIMRQSNATTTSTTTSTTTTTTTTT